MGKLKMGNDSAFGEVVGHNSKLHYQSYQAFNYCKFRCFLKQLTEE
jgi:hypothetical protein